MEPNSNPIETKTKTHYSDMCAQNEAGEFIQPERFKDEIQKLKVSLRNGFSKWLKQTSSQTKDALHFILSLNE